MSGNKFQIKRTGIAGRQPNTTNSSNSSYIDVGELALNFADGILYSSNGTVLLELGANVTNQNITGTLTANGSVGNDGQVLISNGNGIYWGNFESEENNSEGTINIETRNSGNFPTRLTPLLTNFLRVEGNDTFRNPVAFLYNRTDSLITVSLN